MAYVNYQLPSAVGDKCAPDSASSAFWWANREARGPWLPIAGGTMVGSLILAHEPTQLREAATKFYVDQQIALGGDFVDAPADGELYARINHSWEIVSLRHINGGEF